MKLAYVISTQPTQFQAVSYSPDLEENATRLERLGYDGIELAVRDPALLDVSSIRRMLETHNLLVPAIGTGQAWGEEHLSFTDFDATVRERAVQRCISHIPFAAELDALVIIGLIRGVARPPVTPEQARKWMVEAIRDIAEAGSRVRVRFAIEPINRYETNLLNTVADAKSLIDQVAMDNVGILFDTFHSNIEEPNLEASMSACGDRLYHVHVADSNRWFPGAGHLDWKSIMNSLSGMHYAGWASAEILPKPEIKQAQEQTIRTMRPLLTQ